MIGFTGIGFAPLIDWRLVAAAAAIGVLLLAFGVLRGARGSLLRLFALGILALALLNPHLEAENRRGQPDMAVVMVDESSSQNTGERRGQLARALKELRTTLGNFKDLRFKVVRGKETKNGTELFGELERAIADIPKGRFAGAVLLTDGQVHDVPKIGQKTIEENANKPGIYGAPLHVLLTGAKGERDRRLVVVQAPAFGIVGKSVTLRLRIEDNPKKGAASAAVTIHIDGGTEAAGGWYFHPQTGEAALGPG